MHVGTGGVACFWVEATDEVSAYLRRYEERECVARPDSGICDAVTGELWVEKWNATTDEYGISQESYDWLMPRKGDKRWPTECASCGKRFTKAGYWQVHAHRIYVAEDGRVFTPRGWGGEPGMMYDAWWFEGRKTPDGQGCVGPDGIALAVICPGGHHWNVDSPSSTGGRWTRTGDPRNPASLTCSPSIAAGTAGSESYYHGFLQSGRLTDHIG